MKSVSYYVFYVEGCSPRISSFKSEAAAERFVTKFLKKNVQNTDDNWVDGIICGRIVRLGDGWREFRNLLRAR